MLILGSRFLIAQEVFVGYFFWRYIFTSMITDILPRIRQISEEVAETHQAFVVDLSLRGGRQSKVLELFVDTDSGITADGCASISRDLSSRLDHENVVQGRYNLVVSSPGLDRPLKLLRQYQKNIGRSLRVRYKRAGEVRTTVGTLVELREDRIVLKERGNPVETLVPLDEIQESKVEIEFGRALR